MVRDAFAIVTQAGIVLRQLGPEQWFGEIALLRDIPRTATATAAGPLTLVGLDRDTFLSPLAGTHSAHEVATQAANDQLDADEGRRPGTSGSHSDESS